MAENFNLIFGSQAPTTASWSDADYQTGWNVVGSTPPTAEQFDALQNRADKKAQELNNRMLPLEQKAEEQGRQASTAYTVGAAVTVDGLPADWLLVCTTAGTSGTVAITLPDPLLDGATINDGTITWKLRKVATNGGIGYRQPSTAYAVGNIAYHASLPTGWCLKCTTAGITSAGAITPSSTIGDTITDGGVTWTAVKYALTTDVPPLASALATPRKIELTGNVTGSANFDGSKDIQIATSLADVSALAHSLLSKTTAADMREVMDIKISGYGDGAAPITAVIGDFAMAFGQSLIPGDKTELTVQLPFDIWNWGRKVYITQYGYGNYATLMYRDQLSSNTNIVVQSNATSPDGIYFYWLVVGRKG